MTERICLRRVAPTGLSRLLGRRRYEIERLGSPGTGSTRELTTTPVTAIDEQLGVGDAWALVHAADAAWNGTSGRWVTLVDARKSTVKQRYLVAYDYGMGGALAYLLAQSEEEIRKRFPELTVVNEPPDWLTEAETTHIANTLTVDIDDAEAPLLKQLLATRR